MKKSNVIAIAIAAALFVIPFFWLKPGFVDLGGDAGRLYFLDPFAVALHTLHSRSSLAYASYSIIPYELYLAVVKTFIASPTHLIAFERGVQISLAFFSVYLITGELLTLAYQLSDKRSKWIGIAAGIVYVGFITKSGWASSLDTHSQIFLNPLIFYLTLRLFITSHIRYGVFAVILTLLYSGNFGFSATPQILSFYPLSIAFLLLVFRFILKRSIPWKSLRNAAFLFIGLHAFHIIPTAASLFMKNNFYHNYVFADQSIQNSGVHYFAVNHETLGKISTTVFQPTQWSQNILILLIPGIVLLGFMKRPSKLQGVIGIFFAITFFLVSANITKFGVSLYQKMFYIPGFMMFRSFNERWYPVFVFFYTLLFAFSLYGLLRNKKQLVVMMIATVVFVLTVYRIIPFLQGKAIDVPYYQSKNVSRIFRMDPDLLNTLTFIRGLPQDGNALTLPLTFPNYQIAYGSAGGAYVGISMISELIGRQDYPGFWRFGEYAQPIFDAIRFNNVDRMLSILSSLNIRYIFYNSDARIMDNFPGYPYIYPGLMYSSKDQLPAIRDQSSYKVFLASLPLIRMYEKGFYTVFKINYPAGTIVRQAKTEDTPLGQYIYAGRIISVLSAAALVLYVIYTLVRKRYENA